MYRVIYYEGDTRKFRDFPFDGELKGGQRSLTKEQASEVYQFVKSVDYKAGVFK